jgi:hypothetical protein
VTEHLCESLAQNEQSETVQASIAIISSPTQRGIRHSKSFLLSGTYARLDDFEGAIPFRNSRHALDDLVVPLRRGHRALTGRASLEAWKAFAFFIWQVQK